MEKSKTVLLQGEPGTGKSRMACLTALRKPVHVVDIDRKVGSASWAQTALTSGELTYWELNEPRDEENLRARVRQLVARDSQKATKAPLGWERFAEYIYTLPQNEDSKAAGTWVIDSLTLLGEHFKSHIMYLVGKSKYNWDQWNAYKIGWMDTLSFLRDISKEHGKDLILTVHERTGETPGDRTTGVRYETDKEGNRTRVLQGTQDLKVWASIDGSFGQLIGAETDEYYWLHVDVEDGKPPAWRCRVLPDGRRSLRTSFTVAQAEFEPDFRKIWK